MAKRNGRLAAVLAATLTLSAPAAATTPTLLWQGATDLRVQCLVQRDPFKNDAELQAALCARVAGLAARGAPMPVKVAPLGDPALIAPGTVALLVHASVESARGSRLMAFSIRPFRASGEQTSILFAAAPRAVPISSTGLTSPSLDRALTAALSEILPWQNRPQQPLPLDRRP